MLVVYELRRLICFDLLTIAKPDNKAEARADAFSLDLPRLSLLHHIL